MATGEAALGYVALLHMPPIPARLSNYISVISYTLSFRKPIWLWGLRIVWVGAALQARMLTNPGFGSPPLHIIYHGVHPISRRRQNCTVCVVQDIIFFAFGPQVGQRYFRKAWHSRVEIDRRSCIEIFIQWKFMKRIYTTPIGHVCVRSKRCSICRNHSQSAGSYERFTENIRRHIGFCMG
jgi:hypothetical protein